jgi:hypothetical protein
MQTFEDFAELARVCAAQARLTNSRGIAQALWKMANDYQERAAQRDSGQLPRYRRSPGPAEVTRAWGDATA